MASDDKTERTEVSAVPLYQQVMDCLLYTSDAADEL